MRWASTVVQDSSLARAVAAAADQALDALHARPDLGFVFPSSRYGEELADLPGMLPGALRDCMVVGCTGAGVIGGGHEVEGDPAVSVTLAALPGTRLAACHLEDDDLPTPHARRPAWNALLGLRNDARPHFVVLADPFSFDAESFVGALDRHYPDATKVGGLASGGRRQGENVLYVGGTAHAGGAVCLALDGDVAIRAVVAQGCRPVGQPLFVTRAHGNLLLELDGRRPTDILRALYAEADARDRELLPRALFLGLVMRPGESVYGQGDYLIRNLLGVDDETGALWVGAEVETNQVVQFHVRDAVTSAEDLENALGAVDAGGAHPAGALLFSCLGRGEHLYGRPDHDTDAFRRHAGATPLGGFFCNGEIGPVRGRTFVHGYTSAFALFEPRPSS